MMRNRILPMINFLLVLACGGCIWFLATQSYERPRDIADAEKLLRGATVIPAPGETQYGGGGAETTYATNAAGGETRYGAAVRPPKEAKTPLARAEKSMMLPIWSPSPTPTPTPSPTPAPPDLASAQQNWDITSIDGIKVEFVDKRSQGASETFVLTAGGPGRATIDKDNKVIEIRVLSVDSVNMKVMLGFETQTFEKAF